MGKHIGNILRIFIVIAAAITIFACEHIDSNRIPPSNVSLVFNTIGDWERYGVTGAGQTQRFIRSQQVPAGYTYKIDEYTGYGGILLVADPNGENIAYDLACPVEAKPTILIEIDHENNLAGIARCPVCGSRYNLYGQGAPLSGKALEYKYGLQRYQVFVGYQSIPYARVVR